MLIPSSTLQAADRADATASVLAPNTKLAIDGKLDEPAWASAPDSDPFQWLGVKHQSTSPVGTTFKVLRDDDAVYFGITCREPKMSQLADAPMDHDGPIAQRDCVELFLSPDASPTHYYQFLISAGNDIADHYFIESGVTTLGEYNPAITSAVFQGKDLWTVEVRLPLSAFYHTASKDFSDKWQVNVARERQADGPTVGLTTWAPLRRGFHESSKFPIISNMPRKRPKFDLAVTGIQVDVDHVEDSGKGYVGSLSIPVTASSKGNYELSVTAKGQPIVTTRPIKIPAGSSAIEIDHVALGTQAKSLFKVRLTSTSGQVIAAASYTVRLGYVPLVITLDKPFYRHAIFPGQTVETLQGHVKVNLPLDQLKGTIFRIAIEGPGLHADPIEAPADSGSAAFSFDARVMAQGDHPLSVEVMRGDQILAAASLNIPKLPQPPGSCVYLDEHARTIVDGRPLYVRGWYGDDRFLVSQALINKYGRRPSSLFVNAWLGRVGLEAERLDPTERTSERVKKDVVPSDRVFEEMKKIIEAHRRSKTLRWWYLADEPEARGLSPIYLKYQYDFIKEHDPYHPVMIITRDPAAFVDCADILNAHPYLSPTVNEKGVRRMESPKAVRDQMHAILKAGKGKIPAWFTAQAFSYSFNDPQADSPNFMEYRCMMWAAAVNGATGYTPFSYRRHFDSLDLRVGSNFVYESMDRLNDWLISPAKPLAVQITTSDDGVDVMAKKVDGKFLLIAVNLLDRKTHADLQVAGLHDMTKLVGFREEGVYRLNKGKLALDFQPYEVHILTNSKRDQGLDATDHVLKALGKQQAALRKPGNILFNRGKEVEWSTSDTYVSNLSLFALADGLTDCVGWVAWRNHKLPAWIEAQFPTFIPTFKRAVIYSSTIEDMALQAWKDGDWITVANVKANQKPVITINLPAPVRTVKLRLWITKVHPNTKAEVYEIELYD